MASCYKNKYFHERQTAGLAVKKILRTKKMVFLLPKMIAARLLDIFTSLYFHTVIVCRSFSITLTLS